MNKHDWIKTDFITRKNFQRNLSQYADTSRIYFNAYPTTFIIYKNKVEAKNAN